MKTGRELALDVIMDVLERGEFSHIVLRKTLDEQETLSKTERSFITRLCEGTIEEKIKLDYVINQYSKTPAGKMKPFIRCLLRMSVYQLLYMDSVPDSAVCNEAVKIARKRKFQNLSGFVNGVLRNISRNRTEIVYPDYRQYSSTSQRAEALSVQYSMPQWLVEHFWTNYGEENLITILDGFVAAKNERSISVRVNESKATVESVMESLASQKITVHRSTLCKAGLYIEDFDKLNHIDVFMEGKIQVQNVSSILVGDCSGVKPGDYCLDMCSAPGGKAIHLADLLDGTGSVTARDVSEKKCELIKENARRNRMTNLKVQCHDATVFDETLSHCMDVVLCDVPCSGLGVLASKPEIRYRVKKEEMKVLSEISKKILKIAVQYLKDGGTLLMSTCTLNLEENRLMYEYIIKELGGMPVDLTDCLTDEMLAIGKNRETAKMGYLELFPGRYNDGFFLSRYQIYHKGTNNV